MRLNVGEDEQHHLYALSFLSLNVYECFVFSSSFLFLFTLPIQVLNKEDQSFDIIVY